MAKQWAVPSVLSWPLGLLLSGVLFPQQPGLAQLIPDGSTETQIQSGVAVEGLPSDLIEGGTVRDRNLFHSFQDFNVEVDRGVYFTTVEGIRNILTRVTGGNVSNIDGTLGVLGSADLFLINPNGIIFGPDAQLDLSGSFLGSTAASILFENYEFSAAATDTPPLLTLSVPLGLRMGANPGSLAVDQATLSVDQALTLAAGVLDVSGDLQAGGDITLRGQERRLAAGTFTTGGYFFTQDLGGTNVDFLIPHETVIRADGDVQISDGYAGPSLYVLVGGQVTVGDGTGGINIIDTGDAPSRVTATIADGVGGTQDVTVSAAGEPTLNIRAGVDWNQLPGGAPGNENLSNDQVVFGNETGASGATSASILVGDITNSGGRVALSSLFSPNEALAETIRVGEIDTSTSIDSVSNPPIGPAFGIDGGDILISSQGEIVAEDLNTSSTLFLANANGDAIGGNGGDIAIMTLSGDITVSSLDSNSRLGAVPGVAIGGDGGDITLSTTSGNITVSDRGFSGSRSFGGAVLGGTGGDITITSIGGDIVMTSDSSLHSSSIVSTSSGNGIGGESGNITLSTISGDITSNFLSTDTITTAHGGNAVDRPGGTIFLSTDTITTAHGGDVVGRPDRAISFTTTTGDITTSLLSPYSFTSVSSGNVRGGDVGNSSNTTVSSDINAGINATIRSASHSSAHNVFISELSGGNSGDITITTVSGDITASTAQASSFLSASNGNIITGGDSGNIAITSNTGNLNLNDSSLSAYSLLSVNFTELARGGNGGNITLSTDAGDISLGGILNSFAFARTGLAGNGGNIVITTEQGGLVGESGETSNPNASILNTSAVSQSRSGSGNGGHVTLTANNQISNLEIVTIASEAESGVVNITGLGELVLDNVNAVTSATVTLWNPFSGPITLEVGSIGQSGDVIVTGASDLTFKDSSIESSTQGIAPAGDVRITSPGLITFQDTSSVSSNTNSSGEAGNVWIESETGIVLTGPEVSLAALSNGDGSAGSISLDTPNITIDERAEISTVATDDGSAGDIRLDAETLTVSNGSEILAASSGAGDGGDIEVNAGIVQLSDSRLTVNSQGQGTGGNILVVGDFLFLEQGSAIDAATANSDGGNITLSLEEVLLLSEQSEITATAGIAGGDGDGGNIDINAEFVVAAPDGPNRIIANAFEGDGGNITIPTTALLGEQFLEISASSRFGLEGTVTVDSPDIDPANSLVELPSNRVDASSLIADACFVDGSHGRSQFVTTGRGGLPTQPTSYPTGTLLLPDLGPLAMTPPNAPTTHQQEAQTWSAAANGDIVLAANPATTLDRLLGDARQAYQQADYATAATLWHEAAATLAHGNDPVAYASTLSNLALAHHHLGEWEQAQRALTTTQQVLTPELATAHPWLVAQTLNTQASLQLARGDAQAALDDWQQAADAYAQAGNAGGELRVLLNQTQAWQSLGFYPRAETQLEAIVTALADQPPSLLQAMTLLNLGTVLRARGETERSQQILESALAVTQTLNEPALASTIQLNLGHTAQAQTNPDQALAYYQAAAATAPTPLIQLQAQVSQLDILAAQDLTAAQTLWSDVSATLQTNPLPASREAIYTQLHLAAGLLQTDTTLASPDQIMSLLLTAGQQAQRLEDTTAQTYTLGYQAQVYRQMQQWAEAQALTEKALQQAQVLGASEMIYQWAEQLGQLRQEQGDRAGAIAAYTEAVNALSSLRGDLIASGDEVQFTFRDTVEPVYRELVKLLLQGDAGHPVDPTHLTEARRLIENLQLAEVQDYFQDACVPATTVEADDVDPTAAVIYPILLDDRLDVIVSVAGQPMHHHSTPIAAEQVEQTTYQLLETLTTALGSGQASTTQQLQQVYDWILAPVAATLEQQQIETLVFVADGVLRTLPLTALHDGEQYLVERYNVVSSPGLNLLDPRPLERQDLQMLAGGLSESRPGFPPLPFVADEIQQITTQIPKHQVLLNQDLTQANLAESLATTPAGVVHLATHGTFGSSAEETFILTWDGKLNIKELSSLLQARNRSSNTPIELLVFSACRTAAGDSRAVLGIAGMAIRSGVRSTLAGLWPLDDRATSVFMDHFYEALAQPDVTKAEAFRQAQLALMQDPRFSTPYYWSPFVMVGNWL